MSQKQFSSIAVSYSRMGASQQHTLLFRLMIHPFQYFSLFHHPLTQFRRLKHFLVGTPPANPWHHLSQLGDLAGHFKKGKFTYARPVGDVSGDSERPEPSSLRSTNDYHQSCEATSKKTWPLTDRRYNALSTSCHLSERLRGSRGRVVLEEPWRKKPNTLLRLTR
jgi:hypothetical protein